MSSWFLKETGSAISTVYQWLQGDRRDRVCRPALDHMAVMDENESPVEVHLTKN